MANQLPPGLQALDDDIDFKLFAQAYGTHTKEYIMRTWYIDSKRNREAANRTDKQLKELIESLDAATKKLHEQEEVLKKFQQFKQLGMELFGDAIEDMVKPMIEEAGYEVEERMNNSAYERRIGLES